MRGKAFKASPNAMATWQPWIAPGPMQEIGFPLGFDLKTGKVVVYHPWSLPTNSTTTQIEGLKKAGKSTFMKTVAPRMLTLKAKDYRGNPCLMRGRMNSRRSENGVAEYVPLSEALYSSVYDLAGSASINLLGLFQKEMDIIEVTINIAQTLNKGPISMAVTEAFMVGIQKMLTNASEAISYPTLRSILLQLTGEDFRAYNAADNRILMEQYDEEIKLRPDLGKQLEMDFTKAVVDDSCLIAAKEAARLIGLLRQYGKVLYGKDSLYSVLSQQLLTLNWENMPEGAQEIFEPVLMKAEAAAIVRAKDTTDTKSRDLSMIIPHFNLRDEEGVAAKSLMHLRFLANRQARSRAYVTAEFDALQYNTQRTKAGEADSDMRRLGEEIDHGIGGRIIFRQPNDTTFLQRFSELGMSDQDVACLPTLKQGQAAIWIPDHPPLYYQHVVTSEEWPLIKTEGQRSAMSEFSEFPTIDPSAFREQARLLGTIHVGGDN